jgi:hypothetical protein
VGQQHFNATFQELSRGWVPGTEALCFLPASPAIKPGRKNPGIVEHYEVIGPEKVGKFAEKAVPEHSGAAVQVKQPGRGPVGKGFLGNQFGGKMVVELGNQHEAVL